MIAQYWNVTAAERARNHPADAHAPAGSQHLVRAVDVDADRATVFRWLCQLKVAPYSYDLIDNLGRRSPRTLTPGADELSVGQRFMIGHIVDFAVDDFICADTDPVASKIFGDVTTSYQVVDGVGAQSRIVVCLAVGASGPVRTMLRRLLAAGDLVMMRKQLLTLKRCAERTAAVT